MKFPTALAAAGLIARASAFCPGHRPFSPAASRARRSASALRAGGAEEEGFMRMQPAPTTSGYGLGYTPTTPLRPEAGNSFVPAADNVHDIWWTQRRARQRVRAGTAQGAPAAKPEPPVALDQAGVEQVLTEFVQSMYAATLFRNFRCEPTDYGQIAGMFEFVQLERGGVVLKLKRTFGEQNTALLDRMALYLRARIPQMQSIRVMHRDGQDIY